MNSIARKLLVSAIATFTVLSVSAKDISLVKVTNDQDSRVAELLIQTDADNTIVGFSRKVTGSETTNTTFDLEDLAEDGIVVEERKGHVVAKLVAPNFDAESTGFITADFLKNGITNERFQKEFELVKTDSAWELHYNGKSVTSMKLVANVVSGVGAIGIKSVVIK